MGHSKEIYTAEIFAAAAEYGLPVIVTKNGYLTWLVLVRWY